MTRTAMLSAALVALGLAACLDTDPIGEDPEPLADAGADAPENRACRLCLTADAGPCTEAYRSCAVDASCIGAIECVLSLNCFAHPTFDERFACGNPCLVAAGLTSAGHPSLPKLIAVNICANNGCHSACIGE
jgi:hypothetical protein